MMECVHLNGNLSGANGADEASFYDKIYSDYHGVHGYVATILCCFGLLANGCNILVLTRSEMFSTINMLLTSIAICDSILMVSYVIYLAHFQLSSFPCTASKYTFGWAVFTVFHADLSVALRACSLWLSVIMAALRSHILSRHQVLLLQSRYIANKRLGYKLIVSTIVAVLLMTIPVFINHTIDPIPIRQSKISRSGGGGGGSGGGGSGGGSGGGAGRGGACPSTSVAWIVVPPAMTLQYDCLMLKIGYWTNGLLLKLIPCILLTYYLVKLIHFIRMHMQHSQTKFGERETTNSLKPTTFLLSIILFVTLLCELPNALASLLSGVRSFAYGVMIYKNLGDIFDLLALVNGITSFILYCSMSQMFRETFLNFTCDVRDYFTVRSRDYYRRWSTNVFGPSQSLTEFQLHSSSVQRTDLLSQLNGAVDDADQFAHFERRQSSIPGGQQTNDRHRLLGSFDIGPLSMNGPSNRSLRPSPSESSEKLLDEEMENSKVGKRKKARILQEKNDQQPRYDFSNVNMMHVQGNGDTPPAMRE